MSVCCKCCVLSGRGLCDGPITRPEESYPLWCVVCDLEATKILVHEEAEKKDQYNIPSFQKVTFFLHQAATLQTMGSEVVCVSRS
jgi:hypothetical protein